MYLPRNINHQKKDQITPAAIIPMSRSSATDSSLEGFITQSVSEVREFVNPIHVACASGFQTRQLIAIRVILDSKTGQSAENFIR
jgi:hypothetical protein